MSSISVLGKAIRVGRESTPYQAAALSVAHGMSNLHELEFKPDLQRLDNKNLAKTTFGPAPATFDAGASSCKLTTVVPIYPVSAPGSLPEIAELLIACGLLETVNAGVEVLYTPQTPADPNTAPTATLEMYEAGIKQRMVGARGTFTLTGSPKEGLQCKFELSAPWELPATNISLPTIPPLLAAPLSFSTAAMITEDGSTIDIGMFEFALNAEITIETGSTGVTAYLTNHKPTLKINPFAVTTASDWNRIMASQLVAFSASFGSGGVLLNIPRANLVESDSTARGGRVSRAQTWECVETIGDDQFSITFK